MSNTTLDNVRNGLDELNKVRDYVLVEKLGEGAHGVVYKAYHQSKPTELVALKIIEDTGSSDTLLIEPNLLRKLKHPNILMLKNFFKEDNLLCIVTDYLDGDDLETYLNHQGTLSIDEVKVFLVQMADALAHAHSQDVLHRDIKLNNIIVTEEAGSLQFKLVDFGISSIYEGVQTKPRGAGTRYYMAPEQHRGRPNPQSDLWALGVCAYKLLSGHVPFAADNLALLLKKIFLDNPPALSKVRSDVPLYLENIILRLLEKDLLQRTASANDLLEDLKQTDPSLIHKLVGKVSYPESAKPTGEQEIERKIRRSRNLMIVSLAAFVLLYPILLVGHEYPVPVSFVRGGELLVLFGLINFASLYFFVKGQEGKGKKFTYIGLALLFLGWSALQGTSFFIVSAKDSYYAFADDASAMKSFLIPLGLVLLGFVCSLLVGYFFSKMVNYKEELLLYQSLRKSSDNAEAIIPSLKKFVDRNWGNINVRKKYIEALMFSGRQEEGIVEAQLMLEDDPYSFPASLMLANGYFDIGLFSECEKVCDQVLSTVGYAFEFNDLKERCQQKRRKDNAI